MARNEENAGIASHRHGNRTRSLTGSFGPIEIEVPRARLDGADGKTTEWKSQALRAYQRRTLVADALIASTYLAGTITRRLCGRLLVPPEFDGGSFLVADTLNGAALPNGLGGSPAVR